MTGEPAAGPPVAIVGMAGRFPGAPDVDALWSLLTTGTEAVRRFTDAELRAAGVPADLIADPDHLPYGADLAGIEDFDAEFFGMTPAEARRTDPQHRIFLECVWAALEDAGTPPAAHGGRTGVFGGTSLSSYLLHHVLRSAEFRDQAFTYPVLLGNDKDFLATRVSYALDLRGPSVSVQSACSSSLVAVDQACAALRAGGCDVAVAGGVSVFTPQTAGYRHQAGGTFSRDGHCRPFDAAASGMVRGSGCAVVVLKRLETALADRDHVYALVAGTSVNNDGAAKAGYAAPGAAGQEAAVRACLAAAGVPASWIGYVEAHGTGTYLGDPIEVAALDRAYRSTGEPPHACALGSLKANIGHLDAAAGAAGLVKAALVLHHQTIPPQINFDRPNPELRLPDTPFVVHPRLTRPDRPLRAAAVTSLGIGGTNAHCVLLPAPPRPARPTAAPGDHALPLSAPDDPRLRAAAADLLAHLDQHPDTRLDDLSYTLTHGRTSARHQVTLRAATLPEAVERLRDLRDGRTPSPAPAAAAADLTHARRIRLPGTRFDRARHWIEPDGAARADGGPDAGTSQAASATAPAPAADRPPRPRSGDDPLPPDPATAVAEVFRTRLGVAAVDPEDDYTALGGDSLQAIDVVDVLNRRFGARLTPDDLAELRTPRRVAARLGGATTDEGPLVRVRAGRPDATPVFLVHPSGGTIAFVQALARHSTYPGALYGIRCPAALARTGPTIEELARHHAGLVRAVRPAGPYRVGGYSLGGTVALEMARHLAETGEHVDPVLLFDTQPPPLTPPPVRSDQDFLDLFPALFRLALGLPEAAGEAAGTTRHRTVEEAVAAVRAPGWTEATVRELQAMYRTWRACDRANALHRPAPYPGPVHLFQAEDPLPAGPLATALAADAGRAEDWHRYLTGPLTTTTLPGHHFTLFDADHLPTAAAEFDRVLTTTAPAGPRSGPASGPVPAQPGPEPATGRPVALLFPGQGTQFAGMGADLLARHPDLVARADDVLGYPIAEVCAGDPSRPLRETTYAQPAIYVVNALALLDRLARTGERPAVLLGHSVGEYNALVAAGALTFTDGLRLVAGRAAAMARIGGGGMIAVTGLSAPDLTAVLAAGRDEGRAASDAGFARVDLAAVNAPRQHTLAGPDAELDALTPVLLAHGARSVRRLKVSGPFHSRLMRPAADAFRTLLDAAGPNLTAPAIPVIANTTARPHRLATLRAELTAQIDHPVQWLRSVERAIADHDPDFHEIGDRRVLLPLITQIRAAR